MNSVEIVTKTNYLMRFRLLKLLGCFHITSFKISQCVAIVFLLRERCDFVPTSVKSSIQNMRCNTPLKGQIV